MTKVKFATYYLKFKQDLACEGWENRESDFGALFEQDDSIVLGEEWPSPIMSETEANPQRVFNHRVYHLRCNPLITVMQLANNIDTPFESKFTPVVMKNEPSLFVLIDNRKDVRTIAIQNRRKAFSAPQRVAQILRDNIQRALYKLHFYNVEILPKYYPADLFEAWLEHERYAQELRFPMSTPMSEDEIMAEVKKLKGEKYHDDSLMSALLSLTAEAKAAKYAQSYSVKPDSKFTALYVDKTSIYMKNLLTLARATNQPVELVMKDGSSFRCFVDVGDEKTDHIVHEEFDDTFLKFFFRERNENETAPDADEIAQAEQNVVELLNKIKHLSEDEIHEINNQIA